MNTYAAFARDNLLAGAVLLAVLMTVAYATFRAVKQRRELRRAAAWREKRAEQDRIWNERIGTK